MAEGLNSAALHIGGGAIAAAITHLSLHSATPDASGSNETTADREAVTLSDTGGVISAPSSVSFSGGTASGDCKFVGFWSASTGGTFYGYQALDGDQSFNAAGEYVLDSLTLTGSAS